MVVGAFGWFFELLLESVLSETILGICNALICNFACCLDSGSAAVSFGPMARQISQVSDVRGVLFVLTLIHSSYVNNL